MNKLAIKSGQWITRRLSEADAGDCLCLSSEADWNQTEEDWRFIISHSDAYGIESSTGQIVATTVAFTRPGTRWIAMVLVAKACRGHGLASLLLNKLRVGEMSDCSDYLDATNLGAPLYLKRGFVEMGTVLRYQGAGRAVEGKASGMQSHSCVSVSLANDPLHPVNGGRNPASIWCPAVLDYSKALAPESCLEIEREHGRGAVWARPGRLAWQVGPVLASDPGTAVRLVTACLETLSGNVFIDIPGSSKEMASMLEASGFLPVRDFKRMCSGAPIQQEQSGLGIFATAGPDFG